MAGRTDGLTAAFVRAVRKPGRYYDVRGDGGSLKDMHPRRTDGARND